SHIFISLLHTLLASSLSLLADCYNNADCAPKEQCGAHQLVQILLLIVLPEPANTRYLVQTSSRGACLVYRSLHSVLAVPLIKPVSNCKESEFQTSRNPQFVENVAEMVFCRVFSDFEVFGDFLVGISGHNFRNNL